MADTVTVACKLPNGLILSNPGEGGVPSAEPIVLNGARHRLDEDGNPLSAWDVANTFGLTPGVDAAFWAKWEADDAAPGGQGLVKKGIVFAHKSDTKGKTAEMKGVKTGFEPLDKDNPAPGVKLLKKS